MPSGIYAPVLVRLFVAKKKQLKEQLFILTVGV
jgi:hypothetical protein